ncbi:hypothetical protein [Streptomyces sp. YGL11-2]|uniref:hypothetical protein n=1 Tax=Streptomyces sp. YGL11-2 TaxID=3414028 RepID=UPI003CF3518B
MRVRTNLIAIALTAVAVLATAGTAVADDNDAPHGTIVQTADSGPDSDQGARHPGHSSPDSDQGARHPGHRNWSNEDRTSSDDSGPMAMD